MRVGVILPSDREWGDVLALAHAAEESGADSIWVPDGFTDDNLETLTAMAALASSTERVEVGAYMLNPSLREPSMLATVVGSLDRVASGRVRVLLGTGWQRADYEALGREFPSPDERIAATRATLTAIKERTHTPVDVAGVRDDILRLAAAEADGWALSADALDAFFERIRFLERACVEAGRKLTDLRVSCTLRCGEGAAERAAALAEHGMDEILVPAPSDPSHLERLIRSHRATVSSSEGG